MMKRAFDYNEVKKLVDQRLLFSNLEEFKMEFRKRVPEGQTSPKGLSWNAKLSCAEESIDPKGAEEELSLIDEYLVEKGFPLTTEEVVTLEDSGSEVEMVTLDDSDLDVDIDDMLDAGIIPEMDEELRLLSPGTMAYLEKRNTHGYQGVDVSDVWKRDDNFEQLEEVTETQPFIVCAENTPVSVSLQKSPVEVEVQKTPATDERPSSPYNINKWMADKEKAKEEERLRRLERKLAASVPASTPKSARDLEVRVTRSRVTMVKVGRDEDENEDKRKVALDSVRKRIKFDENSEETFTSSSLPEVASEVQEEEEYRLRSTDSSSTNESNAKENHEDDIQEVTKETGKDDEADIKELTKENGKHDEEDDHNSENMDLLGILVSKGDKQIRNHRSSSQEILSSSSSPLRQKQITVPIRTSSKRKSAQIATLLLSSSKKSKTRDNRPRI